jgi:transcriptional regulator with XRE-family HTH domain
MAGDPFSFEALARFADNLYRAREKADVSQEDAAALAALTRSSLDRIENGESIPRLEVVVRIAGAYSVSVGELVEGITWKPAFVDVIGPPHYVVTRDDG